MPTALFSLRILGNVVKLDAPPRSCTFWQCRVKEIAGYYLFDDARDFPTRLDLYLAVADRAANMTTRADQQPFPDHEFALKPASHVGIFGGRMAVEKPGLGNHHVLTLLQFRFDSPLDDEPIAGGDLASQRNPLPNNQGSAIDLVTPWAR